MIGQNYHWVKMTLYIVVLPVFFLTDEIPLLCIIFFFSALKKRETNDLKKLEERESELYNIKSELKNTKDNLAEKNKQMTGRCDNDYSTDEQLIK